MPEIPVSESSPEPSASNLDERTIAAFRAEIVDASLLLEFAVVQGRALEPTLIPRIKKGQSYLSAARFPEDIERAEFEAAYRDLAQAMEPVTAASLKATEYVRWKGSPAARFSWRLYGVVVLCAGVILIDAPFQSLHPNWFSATAIHKLVPFVYGLIGAVTYLLRSAQPYISDRTFDLYRRSEYYNRMVLGFLAGGIVTIFNTDSKASPTSDAMSFLVGYNTDYLFQLIERVAQALFHKDSKQTPPPSLTGVSVVKDTLAPTEAGNGTVSLSAKAPSGGVVIALSADPGLTLTSGSVKIPEGSTSASFTFKVDAGQVPGTKLHIVAKQDGNSVTTSITVA
jgi:hypothetical protein